MQIVGMCSFLMAMLNYAVPVCSVVMLPLKRVVGNQLGSTLHGDPQMPISNFQNIQFYASVSVGSPPQVVQLLVDTGSSNVWLPGLNATGLRFDFNAYNSSASTTYTAIGTPIELDYGSGAVRGFQSSDDFSLGGIVAQQFVFTEVSQARGYSVGINFDGILGLGWPALSIKGLPPFMTALGIDNFLQCSCQNMGATLQTRAPC